MLCRACSRWTRGAEPGSQCSDSVGLVLADSSIVTSSPYRKILVQFDVEVAALAWALISFNLALALFVSATGGFCRLLANARLRRRSRHLCSRVTRLCLRPRSARS